MSAICPLCKKDDAIQRVVTVYQAGRSSGTYSGPSGGVTYSNGKWGSVSGYSTLSGTNASDLANLLAPPLEPQQGRIGCAFWIALIALGIPIIIYLPMAFLMSIGAIGSFFNGTTSEIGGKLVLGGLCVGGPLIIVVLALLGILITYISEKRKKDKSDIRYASEKPAWDNAMLKWNRLYLCHRDGIVFDPANDITCQPNQILKYIYQ
jgi:hypothetical protein